MRRVSLSLVSAGLLLSGCVPPPQPYGNPYAPAYAQPQGGPGQPYVGPDGLTYVDGYPVDTIDGYQAAYVFVPALGGWGYYDGGHHWRGAPPGMRERLERFHPGGRGIPPGEFHGGGRPGPGYGGGGFQGRPGGYPDRQGGFQGRPGPGPGPGGFQGRPGFGGAPPGQPGPGGPPGRPGPGGPPQARPPGPPPARPAPPPPRPAPHTCPPGQARC